MAALNTLPVRGIAALVDYFAKPDFRNGRVILITGADRYTAKQTRELVTSETKVEWDNTSTIVTDDQRRIVFVELDGVMDPRSALAKAIYEPRNNLIVIFEKGDSSLSPLFRNRCVHFGLQPYALHAVVTAAIGGEKVEGIITMTYDAVTAVTVTANASGERHYVNFKDIIRVD